MANKTNAARPIERLSSREFIRMKERTKRDAVLRAGNRFWNDVFGRTKYSESREAMSNE